MINIDMPCQKAMTHQTHNKRHFEKGTWPGAWLSRELWSCWLSACCMVLTSWSGRTLHPPQGSTSSFTSLWPHHLGAPCWPAEWTVWFSPFTSFDCSPFPSLQAPPLSSQAIDRSTVLPLENRKERFHSNWSSQMNVIRFIWVQLISFINNECASLPVFWVFFRIHLSFH